jgi:hypothetical protein
MDTAKERSGAGFAHGPIIPLGSNVLALKPVSPFRPRRWRGALLPCSAVVELTNLDLEKRPLGASADFHEVRDVAWLTVQEDRSNPSWEIVLAGKVLSQNGWMHPYAGSFAARLNILWLPIISPKCSRTSATSFRPYHLRAYL